MTWKNIANFLISSIFQVLRWKDSFQKSLQDRIKELGPGSDNRNLKENEYGKNIIYVGGFGEFYNIKNSLLAINQVKILN